MQIRKLEIFGFKSFKNKTVLEFNNDGITGIVGPNGCGKSNIVDSLLWVMGETSPKHLRSGSFSDIIFSGTSKESPSGFAEVSLTLSKGETDFPEKYKNFSEIMITRKSYRDGKTEYFINQQACLLRDIKEVFMDTGAGCKGFSIIEQESIEKLITAKPQERRFIIEEVAGITKFKTRKGESIRKLDLVNQNLKRLDDVIKNQEKQLNHLSAQAKKAEKYRHLKKDINSREIEMLYRFFNEISQEQKDLKIKFHNQKETKEKLEQSIRDNQESLISAEKKIKQQESLLEKDEKYLVEINYKILERQKEIEKIEDVIKFYSGNIKKQEDSEQEQQKEIEISKLKIKEIEGKKEGLIQEEKDLKNELVKIEQFLSNKKDDSNILKQKEETEIILQKIQNEKLNKESQMNGIVKHLEVLTREQNKDFSEKEMLEEKIRQNLKNKDKISSLVEKNKQVKLNFDRDLSNTQNNIKILEDQRSALQEEIGKSNQNISLLKYKIEEIENMIHRFESLNEGNAHLNQWKPETFKPLFKHLKIESGFEQALGSVLGPHIQALVSTDKHSILDGIKELKLKRKGRSSFFSSLPSYEMTNISRKNLEKFPAFICYLEEKIQFNLETDSLRQILKNTVVVSDLNSAIQLKEKFPSLQFVTKEGDLVTRESIIYGGSSEKETNLFKFHNQIEENKSELKFKETNLKFKKSDFDQTTQKLKKMKQNLKLIQNQTEQSAEHFISYRKDLEQLDSETIRLTNEKSSSQKKWDSFEEEKEEIIKHQNSLKVEIEDINKMVEKQTVILKNLQMTENQYKNEEKRKMEIRMKSFQNSKEQSSLEQEINLLTNFIEKSFSKRSENYENKSEIEGLMKKEQNQILEIKKELDLLSEEKSQLETTISSHNKIKNKETDLKNTCIKDGTRFQNELTQIAIDKNTYQSEQEKLEIKKQNISDKLYENYQINIKENTFVPQYASQTLDQLKSELEKLQEKIQKMNVVNLLALTEYEELLKDQDFLTSQKQDLTNSRKELNKVISHIDHLCEKRFKDMLAEINMRFSKIFPIIFEGDNAEASLILKEDPDMGEPGIDILVRPPGKRPQSVMLLSRGEKALTSICLIYALFLVKPSPFCIVDEIDSPLDDANIFRLISVLKEMSLKSQIITITHNKYTMRACKKLYGVTMERPGISQLVSVDMSKQDLFEERKTLI